MIEGLADHPRLQRFVRHHEAIWISAHEQVQAFELEIEELSKPWKAELSNLMTVPGVGTIVALTVWAVLFDAKRFPSAKHVASYAGLVPGINQSGEREHSGHIVRRGSGELRSMLCEAARTRRSSRTPSRNNAFSESRTTSPPAGPSVTRDRLARNVEC